ncbi:MAG TPA: peptidase domain-containing ABC transporter [Mycobacteriales bacterium]|jgi:ABC-type bacteriocin/lantibiotic exporter with double-glycine peptidase domain|nr:peptidase domain-containing ABC transporter [Mycobacteriales bacterium]
MTRRVRFRSQVEIADCGAASLAMVLDLHGKAVPFDEVRTVTGTGRDGTDALTLVEAAKYYGMNARGVKTEVEDLEALPTGAMLFWDLSHFVVLDKVGRRGIDIVDPALGRRFVRWEEVRRSYAGVALLMEPGPDFVRGGRRKHGIWRHVRPLLEQHATLRRSVTTSLLIRVLALGLPLLTAALVDRVVPTGDRGLLTVIGLSLAVAVAFHFLTSWLRGLLLLDLRTRVDLRTTLGFLDHLVSLPYTFHLNRSSGDLMMRLRSNSVVRELLTTTTLSALLDGAFATLYLVLLIGLSLPLGLLVLGLGTLQVVVLLLSRRATQRLASEGLRAEARSQGYAFQLLAGIGTLKSSGTEQHAVDEFSRLFTDELSVSLRRGRLSAFVDSMTGALSVGSPLIVLTVAGVEVLNGAVSLGTALAVNALAVGFLGPLATLVTTGLSVQVLTSYVERLNDVFDTPREQEGEDVRPAPALSGRIRAEDLSFRYAPLSPVVVDGVSLAVEPGQTIALVGRSGSGKTTLGHLLLGLYRPSGGRVLHDDIDLAELDAKTVRTQFGVVTQDPYLFATSLRDNIAFGDPGMSLDQVREAARVACVDDDIMAMPLKYDTVLSDAGASLSGGQRQRVALARALASRPRVLLLDEATSHLDAVTESAVHANLADIGCTTVVVAHRLSTVVNADLILVVDRGKVVEQGTHAQLLRRKGAYHELVNSQLESDAPVRRAAAPRQAAAPRKAAPRKAPAKTEGAGSTSRRPRKASSS